MAKLSQLVSRQSSAESAQGSGANAWYAEVVAPAPAALTDILYVTIPELNVAGEYRWACNWGGSSTGLPVVGDPCLVTFDNRQQLWATIAEKLDLSSYATEAWVTSQIPTSGIPPTRTIYTSGSGTYNTPDGVIALIAELIAGGGGGGGAGAGGNGLGCIGSGGGAAGGQYVRKLILNPSASYAYAVGGGGTGGVAGGAAATAGVDTTFGVTLVVAKGGAAGANGGATYANYAITAGGVGSTAGGVGDIVIAGGDGSPGFGVTGGNGSNIRVSVGGNGGNGGLGGGGGQGRGGNGAAAPGYPGRGYGGGGGGGAVLDGGWGSGGDGAGGLVALTELY